MPTISVIVPVYNAERHLECCVDSILSQTFEDFELILVDDGSSDHSGMICDEYAEKDTRITVIHQKNQGLTVAAECGIKRANGEWLAIVERVDRLEMCALSDMQDGKKVPFVKFVSSKKAKRQIIMEHLLSRVLLGSRKKWIKLNAYLWNNLGDDLMVKILLERYPGCAFFVDAPNAAGKEVLSHKNFWSKEKVASRYRIVNQAINRLTRNRLKDRVIDYIVYLMDKNCRCYVQIGGSLFVPLKEMTLDEQMARERKRLCYSPLFVMGVNFNPKETQEFTNAFAQHFADCEHVSFRDKASYQLFAHLPNVRYAPDIVFNLKTNQKETSQQTVLISVINLQRREDLRQYAKAYEDYIINICKATVDRGFTPIMCSFCDAEGDEEAIETIFSKLPPNVKEKARTSYYRGDTKEILDLYSATSFVVATRFHAMILAICYKKPFFIVNYNDKIMHILNDFDMPYYCRLEELPTMTAEKTFAFARNKSVDTSFVQEASAHFVSLDSYLSS